MMQIFIKKMWTLIVITLFVGAGIISAANSNETFADSFYDTRVEIESAFSVADAKLLELNKLDYFSIGDSNEKYKNDDGNMLFYIFNLQPQGYIVVTADYNLPPVVAYSFTSGCQSDSVEDNMLIELLKTDIELRFNNIENIPESILEERNLLWDGLLNDKNTNSVNMGFQQWPPEGTTLTEGWVETNWHQDSPYNDFCPIDPSSGDIGVAGCPVVAMSQILNYHRTINSVFFNDSDDYYHNYINRFWIDDDYEEYDFPSFPELNGYLGTLASHYENQILLTDDDKAALNFACGVAATQVYTPEVSGTFGVNQAYDAYIKFNCTTVELLDDNDVDLYEKLSQNMKNAYPVHLAVVTPAWDTGHNLVVDGYNTDDYYHLNFGAGGYYDGWYLLPDELPLSLTVIEGAIVDIMNDGTGPDLNCNGALSWSDVTAEGTANGSFTVENIGDSGSRLDWEIESYPGWGTWIFTPSNGDGLTPEDEQATVEVSVVAPDKKGKEFNGGIKIVNKESGGDCCYIQVSLATPKNKPFSNPPFLKFLESHPHMFPMLKYLLGI